MVNSRRTGSGRGSWRAREWRRWGHYLYESATQFFLRMSPVKLSCWLNFIFDSVTVIRQISCTTSVATSAFGPPQFEGLVSDSPFSTITLSVPSRGGYFVFDATTAAVPDPSTWTMMLLGFVTLGWPIDGRSALSARLR
jgi:hypothetical protein